MTRVYWIGIAFLALTLAGCRQLDRAEDRPVTESESSELSSADSDPASPDSSDAESNRLNEVIVMGMIHRGHLTSEKYGLEEVRTLIEGIDPDFLLVEIPPDRLPAAVAQFRDSGVITEPRVKVFPEYLDVAFPLSRSLDFEFVPCAGWNAEMAKDRREKLARWGVERPEASEEVQEARQWASETIAAEGLGETPAGIHSDRYDEIVKRGMEPYSRLFNEDLGAGGWENINAAHYALIEKALDEYSGTGRRFLITFGSWHKYWFLEKLRERDDIRLRPLSDFL